jgi:hypothetical protein
MRGKKWFIFLASLALVLLANSMGVTRSSFVDLESSTGNFFQGWTSRQWTQTTESQFNDGVLNNADISSSSGNVLLESVAQEPTTSVGSEESWHYVSWSRRAPVDINNPGSGLADYQVRVDVTYDAEMQPDFADIRFTDSNDSTELSHWRESYIDSTSAVFRVKVPSVPSGSKTIYLYYGNGAAISASDGTATFIFFDDFSGSLSKWNIHIGTDVAINPSYGNPAPCLEISGGSTSSPYGFAVIGSDATYTGFQDGIIEADIYPDTDALPEIIFRGDFSANTGYKGRWDCRTGSETPWMKPPYSGWGGFGTAVTRLGIAGQWQKAKLVIYGSTFEIYSDDILQSTVTDAQYPGPGEIGLANHYGVYARFDNVRVRQYANPEPAVSIGPEDGWSRRAPVTINNPGSSLTDYQVRVDVTYDADMQSNFDDIRFREPDGSTELSHWRESYIASTSAIFWVKVPSIPSGSRTIYMYYGNSTASSASDGDATFEFFDDFEDGDISDWFQYVNGTVQIANDGGNYVLLKTAYNDKNGGYSLFNNGALSDFEVVLRTKRINENGGSQNRYGIENGSFNGYGPRMYDFNTLPSNFAIERRSGGGGSNLVLKSTSAYQWNTWMTVKFRKSGSTLEFELYNSSGSLVESISTSNSSYNSFDRFLVHGGWQFYTDDIRVRKYVQPAYISSGTIASQVLDTGINGDRWDALFWDETLPAGTDITFEVRASDSLSGGFPDTSWVAVGGTSPVSSGLPSGRYMQWRATLTTSDPSETPILHEVRVYYD